MNKNFLHLMPTGKHQNQVFGVTKDTPLWGSLWQGQDLGLYSPGLGEAAGAQLTFPLQAAVWAAFRTKWSNFMLIT